MGSLLYNLSVLHQIDAICMTNGGEVVGDRLAVTATVGFALNLDAIAPSSFTHPLAAGILAILTDCNSSGNCFQGISPVVLSR